MAEQTTHLGLNIPQGEEMPDSTPLAENFETLDREVFRRGKAINGVEVNENGDFILEEVPYARNLVTDEQQSSSGDYLFRTTGGSASLSDGEATLVGVHGRSVHTGIVQEQLTLTVNNETRPTPAEGEEAAAEISAVIDRDTFVAYVENPATITVVLEYTDAWSANPTLYGVTVEGTPIYGDSITIAYVRADRGTITNAYPTAFRSTGWNLYNPAVGYARVKRYSDTYGFLVGGTYTSLEFSETLTGSKSAISVSDGAFTVPSDGYVWVTGGNSINTYIMMTWSDWTSGPQGGWVAYSETSIDLSGVMSNCFPYGLGKVGAIIDEIYLGQKVAVRRIDRIAYTDEDKARLDASGVEYDADANYIYFVLGEPVTTSISVSDKYTANDHGLEIVNANTAVAPFIQTLYGENLVDKLRTDVVTKSSDLVNNGSYTGTGKALDARMGKTLTDQISAVEDGMAILATGNTHAAIANGQFVYVKGHGSLAEGLYKAKAAIAANATLSTSNLTADASGGLNDLQSQVTTLNSNIVTLDKRTDGSKVAYTTNINPDTYTTPGQYHVSIAAAYSPTGSTIWGLLDVSVGTGGLIIQKFFSTDDNFYLRIKASSSSNWYSWDGIATFSKFSTVGTLSASDKTSSITGGYIKVGKIVIVSFVATVNSALAANDVIVTGLPRGATQYPIIGYKNVSGERGTPYIARVDSGSEQLYANDAMSTGLYVFSGSYISQ